MPFCLFLGSMGRPPEGKVQKPIMSSLLCLLFSDHACVLLCVSMHPEVELLTHEEIPAQCGMTTQEWMATEQDQTSDTCMANRPNMRGNPTAPRTQSSLPTFQALIPCARQPGFRARHKARALCAQLAGAAEDIRARMGPSRECQNADAHHESAQS